MRLSFLCVPLALAACSPSAEPEAPEETQATSAPAPIARPRAALSPEDIEGAALTGELGCSFNEGEGDAPLLVAMADVRDEAIAEGVLKLGPSALSLRADAPGGFNALVDGARFTSGDLTAAIAVTSPKPLGGGESPPRAATLTLESEALAPQQIEGRWTCGP